MFSKIALLIFTIGFLVTVDSVEIKASPGRPFDPSATKLMADIEAIYYFTDSSTQGVKYPVDALSTLREALEDEFGINSDLELIHVRGAPDISTDRFKRLYIKLTVGTVELEDGKYPVGAFSIKLSRYFKPVCSKSSANLRTLDHDITSGIEEPDYLMIISFKDPERATLVLKNSLRKFFLRLKRTYNNSNQNKEKN